MSFTDVSVTSRGMGRGREREKGGKRGPSSDSIAALRSELEARKLEMEFQRLEDFQARQEERIERARRKRLEPARLEMERQKQAERQRLILEMEQAERSAHEAKIRRIIAEIRLTVIEPFLTNIPRKIIPAIYLRFDEYFRNLDIESYSEFELYKIAEVLRDQITDDYYQEQDRIREGVEAEKRAELQRRKEEQDRIQQEQQRRKEEKDRIQQEKDRELRKEMEELDRKRTEMYKSLFEAIINNK
jgi:hypothetical protein